MVSPIQGIAEKTPITSSPTPRAFSKSESNGKDIHNGMSELIKESKKKLISTIPQLARVPGSRITVTVPFSPQKIDATAPEAQLRLAGTSLLHFVQDTHLLFHFL